jgi:hypothetical protein
MAGGGRATIHAPSCLLQNLQVWPAPGSEDTELGVLMELEVGHGETKVYPTREGSNDGTSSSTLKAIRS